MIFKICYTLYMLLVNLSIRDQSIAMYNKHLQKLCGGNSGLMSRLGMQHGICEIPIRKLRFHTYHRQSVTIPTKPSLNIVAIHSSPSSNNVLDRASENVTVMWQASCKRRAIIKGVSMDINDYCTNRTQNFTT